MGLICVEKATGAVREWVRNGQPASYDPAVHELIEADEPPPDGARLNLETRAWIDPPTPPDVRGFLGLLKAAFPLAQRVPIAQRYPWFLKAVEDQNWDDVQGYVQLGLADGVLTQQQYEAIKVAAAAKNIPVTLP